MLSQLTPSEHDLITKAFCMLSQTLYEASWGWVWGWSNWAMVVFRTSISQVSEPQTVHSTEVTPWSFRRPQETSLGSNAGISHTYYPYILNVTRSPNFKSQNQWSRSVFCQSMETLIIRICQSETWIKVSIVPLLLVALILNQVAYRKSVGFFH